MPAEAPTSTPPSGVSSSPPSGVNIVGNTSAPAPPPAPTKAIHVDATGNLGGATPAVDKGPAPDAPKKGSAFDRMREELQKKAKPTNAPDDPPPSTNNSRDNAAGTNEEAEAGGEKAPTTAEAAAATDKKTGKPNPWKLVEEYKGKSSQLEKEIAELRKSVANPEEQKKVAAEIEQIRKRNQELEEHIRYTDYSKSREFADKYQKPYEAAWTKAMTELSELTVRDVEGNERPLAPQDMLALVNMPLKEARAQAVEVFGDFADDVMAHRKEIKQLFEAQATALEEARKGGEERQKQMTQKQQELMEQTRKALSETWQKANDEVLSHEKFGQFFKPVEGDEEGNKRLQRGYEIADKAFSGIDPRDPRLTPQQREEIVRVHAAVRNRAAGFGRAMLQLDRANAEIASLKSELAKYRGSEPGRGEGNTTPSTNAPSSAKESIFAALRARAH